MVIFLLSPVLLAIPAMIPSAKGDQRWEILNPEGVIKDMVLEREGMDDHHDIKTILDSFEVYRNTSP
jgi:hypothetical protein